MRPSRDRDKWIPLEAAQDIAVAVGNQELQVIGDRSLGSDIHVMLTLRRRSRQVVMADEKLKSPDMVGELLGKGQRVTDQPGHALPQRVVEPRDVIGFAG